MAKELEIIIDEFYTLNGDVFQLKEIMGDYFLLSPVRVKGKYHTNEFGDVIIKSIHFANAEIFKA